jgi:hypothetical protein
MYVCMYEKMVLNIMQIIVREKHFYVINFYGNFLPHTPSSPTLHLIWLAFNIKL